MDVFMWKSSINEVFSIATFHHRRPEWLWPISPWWNFGQAPQKAYPVCSFLFIAMLSSHVCSHVYVHRLHPYLLLLLAQMHIIITYHHYISITYIYIYTYMTTLYMPISGIPGIPMAPRCVRHCPASYGACALQAAPCGGRRCRWMPTDMRCQEATVSHGLPLDKHGKPMVSYGLPSDKLR